MDPGLLPWLERAPCRPPMPLIERPFHVQPDATAGDALERLAEPGLTLLLGARPAGHLHTAPWLRSISSPRHPTVNVVTRP
jgi:hypothetical protein